MMSNLFRICVGFIGVGVTIFLLVCIVFLVNSLHAETIDVQKCGAATGAEYVAGTCYYHGEGAREPIRVDSTAGGS